MIEQDVSLIDSFAAAICSQNPGIGDLPVSPNAGAKLRLLSEQSGREKKRKNGGQRDAQFGHSTSWVRRDSRKKGNPGSTDVGASVLKLVWGWERDRVKGGWAVPRIWNSISSVDARSVGENEAESHIGLELGGVIVPSVGLVAPVADGFGGGGSERGVSTESTDVGNRAVFGDLDFEDYVAGAAGGESFGRILGLGTAEQAVSACAGDSQTLWNGAIFVADDASTTASLDCLAAAGLAG